MSLTLKQSWKAYLAASILVVLGILDVLSTNHILAHGGCEANPIMSWLITSCGNWWAVVKVVLTAAVSLWMVARWQYRLARVIMCSATVFYFLVVGWNFVMLLR